MGVTVRQKVRGKRKPWWIFIAHNGRRKSIKVGDKAAAEALASKIREKLKAGDLQMASKRRIPTFGEYAQTWLSGYGETQLKYSTRSSYLSVFRNHLDYLSEKPLNQITRTDIRELIFAKLKDGHAANTVAHIKALVSSILTHALDEGLIKANPASRLGRLIKTKERKADIDPLTREEAQAFLASLQEHYPQHYPFFLCALRTGMRLCAWANLLGCNGGMLISTGDS